MAIFLAVTPKAVRSSANLDEGLERSRTLLGMLLWLQQEEGPCGLVAEGVDRVGSMLWNNKVVLWVILLAIGLVAYVTYIQLAPLD